MKQNSEYSKPSYILNSQTISWHDGKAWFPKYGVQVTIKIEDFTLGWVTEMEGKLAALVAAGLLKK